MRLLAVAEPGARLRRRRRDPRDAADDVRRRLLRPAGSRPPPGTHPENASCAMLKTAPIPDARPTQAPSSLSFTADPPKASRQLTRRWPPAPLTEQAQGALGGALGARAGPDDGDVDVGGDGVRGRRDEVGRQGLSTVVSACMQLAPRREKWRRPTRSEEPAD